MASSYLKTRSDRGDCQRSALPRGGTPPCTRTYQPIPSQLPMVNCYVRRDAANRGQLALDTALTLATGKASVHDGTKLTMSDLLFLRTLHEEDILQVKMYKLPSYNVFWYEFYGHLSRSCFHCVDWVKSPHIVRSHVVKPTKLPLPELFQCIRGDMYCDTCCTPLYHFE